MEKLGINNLKPIVALGIEMGNVADKIGREQGVKRWMHIADLFDELLSLGKVDFKMVSKEIDDLDESEKLELNAFLKEKFNIVDDKLEVAIEGGLKLIADQYSLVKKAIKLANDLKSEEK